MKDIHVRLSDEDAGHLQELANAELRSLNAQVVALIRAAWRELQEAKTHGTP
jgi:hypothetical protein